jgi:hypothetical protein
LPVALKVMVDKCSSLSSSKTSTSGKASASSQTKAKERKGMDGYK